MASNDPSDTGGLFISGRPGSRPPRLRDRPAATSTRRRRVDGVLAGGLLLLETLLCLSLFGPQPAAWFWIGSQAEFHTGEVTVGISIIMIGCLASLMLTLAVAKRLDHAWKLVRRAAGHQQTGGALETIFAISVGIALVAFTVWFLVIQGPGPSIAPQN